MGEACQRHVRLTWVKTMHKSATVYAALCSMTNLDQSSDISMQTQACHRPSVTVVTSQASSLASSQDPFDIHDSHLSSLGNGVSAVLVMVKTVTAQ